jgi:transcriptional regulator with XRE-family HTH domain
MNFFAANLKYLRKQKGLNQTDFAHKIGINRPKVGSYEEGRAEPSLETLQNISHFFKVKIDDLLEKDLSQTKGLHNKNISGSDLRILPIVVDEDQNERISMVPVQAAAGYLNGYADPEFVEELPSFNLPLQELNHGTFRVFQIKGDSMLPIQPGSYLLAEYVDDWRNIIDQECYVLLTKDEGMVYKRLLNQIEESQTLALQSDNKEYKTFSVKANDVLEVWKAKGYISFDLPEVVSQESHTVDELAKTLQQLKGEVERLKRN